MNLDLTAAVLKHHMQVINYSYSRKR